MSGNDSFHYARAWRLRRSATAAPRARRANRLSVPRVPLDAPPTVRQPHPLSSDAGGGVALPAAPASLDAPPVPPEPARPPEPTAPPAALVPPEPPAPARPPAPAEPPAP